MLSALMMLCQLIFHSVCSIDAHFEPRHIIAAFRRFTPPYFACRHLPRFTLIYFASARCR